MPSIEKNVPVSGEGSVNRRIPRCDTFEGVKALHQIHCISIRGRVAVREASCYTCNHCQEGNPQSCSNVSETGSLITRTVQAQAVRQHLTRNTLLQRATDIAKQAKPGDFIAVEVHNNPIFAFHLCKIAETATASDIASPAFLTVQHLYPVAPGSMLYYLNQSKSSEIPVHQIVASVSLAVEQQRFITRSGLSNMRYRLKKDEYDRITRNLGMPDAMIV